ncbi:hypothetical protein SKAU_G00170450 [Synaphobranchus kaupii]|uniref:Uncharacterized protein n=1 Tax=Synaphobranchus kaupii TaxID=118154 RepID=A0A9Q1FKA3_SYNKA|nr:hypothetical protein SKAU_G00170450 [Synaphobranchus kaupii]
MLSPGCVQTEESRCQACPKTAEPQGCSGYHRAYVTCPMGWERVSGSSLPSLFSPLLQFPCLPPDICACSLGFCYHTLRRSPLTANAALLLMCCRSCLCCRCCRPAVAVLLLPLPCCHACVLPGLRCTVLLYHSRSSPCSKQPGYLLPSSPLTFPAPSAPAHS